MNFPTAATFRTALVAAALAAPLITLPALAGQPASATGAGFFADSSRVFAFSAVRLSDGTVTGQGTLIRPGQVHFHFAVTCLEVEGNVATLTGVITNNDWVGSDQDYTGNAFWFQVVDGGEGRKAPRDRMSSFFFNETAICTEDCVPTTCTEDLVDAGLSEIASGNIQVRSGN